MVFKLPEVHEISVDIDGQCFFGSWYIVLGDMVVNYNGHTLSTDQRETDADKVAMNFLADLVREHYVPLESIPDSIPEPIRNAAHEYLNSEEPEMVAESLISAFGESVVGSTGHRQLSWLCVNSLSMIVPAWKHMCDGNAAEEIFHELRAWLEDSIHQVDWTRATTPVIAMRDGHRVGDCDACRLEPIAEAVANTAKFLQSGQPANAVETLIMAGSAYDEGCHSEEAPDRFHNWLVFDLLPASLEGKSVVE